jgi:hypothetical protein
MESNVSEQHSIPISMAKSHYFYPGDGGSILLRNAGIHLPYYTVSQHRLQYLYVWFGYVGSFDFEYDPPYRTGDPVQSVRNTSDTTWVRQVQDTHIRIRNYPTGTANRTHVDMLKYNRAEGGTFKSTYVVPWQPASQSYLHTGPLTWFADNSHGPTDNR